MPKQKQYIVVKEYEDKWTFINSRKNPKHFDCYKQD